MTNEEAINMLHGIRADNLNLDDAYTKDKYEALGMAIKALEQEPCEDCISRAELLKAVDTWDKFGCDADTKLVPIKDCYVPYIHYDDVVKAIKGMPSIQPKTDVLDKIRAEINRQEKWLSQAGYTAYNVDIAFDTIKAVLAESEVEE